MLPTNRKYQEANKKSEHSRKNHGRSREERNLKERERSYYRMRRYKAVARHGLATTFQVDDTKN